jgi:hypothetical protein
MDYLDYLNKPYVEKLGFRPAWHNDRTISITAVLGGFAIPKTIKRHYA